MSSSFRRALSYKYFGKVVLIHFVIIWNNLLEHIISVEFLLMKRDVPGALRGSFLKLFAAGSLYLLPIRQLHSMLFCLHNRSIQLKLLKTDKADNLQHY